MPDENRTRLIAIAHPLDPLPDSHDKRWHVIVTKNYEQAMKPVEALSTSLIERAGWSLATFAAIAGFLWLGVIRMLRNTATND